MVLVVVVVFGGGDDFEMVVVVVVVVVTMMGGQAKDTLVPRDRRFLVTWCLKTESPNRVRMRVFCRAFA